MTANKLKETGEEGRRYVKESSLTPYTTYFFLVFSLNIFERDGKYTEERQGT